MEFDRFYQSDITTWENDYTLTTAYPQIVPVSVDGFEPVRRHSRWRKAK